METELVFVRCVPVRRRVKRFLRNKKNVCTNVSFGTGGSETYFV